MNGCSSYSGVLTMISVPSVAVIMGINTLVMIWGLMKLASSTMSRFAVNPRIVSPSLPGGNAMILLFIGCLNSIFVLVVPCRIFMRFLSVWFEKVMSRILSNIHMLWRSALLIMSVVVFGFIVA